MTPAPARYFVEKPYSKNWWSTVTFGSLEECRAWIKEANRGKRRRVAYRVVDRAGNVVEGEAGK